MEIKVRILTDARAKKPGYIQSQMVREFDTMSYLESVSHIKEDLGNMITSFI